MSPRAEKVLIALLPDTESLVILTREGLPEECVPSEELRDVLVWAKEYYGRTRRAPSVEMVKERYGDLLSDHEIDIDDEPDETMEWVIDSLKANRVKAEVARHTKDMVRGVREAPPEHKVEALAEHVSRLSALSIDLLPSYQQADLRDSIIEVLDRHDERAAEGHVIRGLRFGLPDVDEYYGGVHPGEVAVVAAPAKMGKSFFMTWCAYKNWEAGVPVGIFPLENGREMTEMRIACQATGIDYNDLDRGLLSSQDMDTLVAWVNDVLLESDTPLMIFEPDVATPHAMLQQAHAYDLDGVILDQLTFIQPTKVRRDAAPREVIQQNMRDLHNLAARGRKKLPIIMAHQINREGIKNAARTGWLTMTDMAESSEVERASDFVFGLYGSDDMIRSGMIQLQSLASRRVQGRSYDLNWHPAIGGISVHEQIELPTDFR